MSEPDRTSEPGRTAEPTRAGEPDPIGPDGPGRSLPPAVTPKGARKKRKKEPKAASTSGPATPAAAESLSERPMLRTGQPLPRPAHPVRVTTVTAEECEPADHRELLGLMRDWRKGRATKKLGEVISDAYVVVFGVLLVGAMAVNVVLQAQTTVSQCATVACTSARLFLPWATVALVAGLALSMARLFGPVLASAAEGTWLMSAPVGRARLLRPRLVSALLIALLGGALVGILVTLLSGTAGREVAAWTIATGLSAAAVVAWAAAWQTAGRSGPARWSARLFALLGLAVLVLVVALAAGWTTFTLPGVARIEIAAAVAAGAVLLLVVCAVVAGRRLDRIERLRLTSGGSLVSGLSGAFYALDLGLIHDIVVERRAREKGHVRAMRGSGEAVRALVLREVQRALRSPAAVPTVLLTAVVPYAADALGLATVVPFLGALAVFVSLIPLTGGLRVLTRNSGLARTLPFTNGQIRRATVVVPAVVALVWAIASAPAFVGFGESAGSRPVLEAVQVTLLTAFAGLMGAVRWTTAKPVNWGAPMASTPAGAIPPGMITAPIRGIDMVLLITAPILLNLPLVVSFVIAAIVAVVLLGGFSSEGLQATREQQQKELERQRAARRR
ncbi:DUF6297 family protein [Desertihabitans aurantiacus]|uniref:DUF6297 family protein n=1 Tax=Desertihabitans aurantiacus TaxID=2282477 RepID=UPI000DF822CA|nr:DUF6297 family protein [Desertihabitans aurantiacus]